MRFKFLDKMRLLFQDEAEMAILCHHDAHETQTLLLGERRVHVTLARNREGNFLWCADCLIGITQHCAHCGEPIFAGDPVMWSENPMEIFCMRSKECAQKGERLAFWVLDDESCRSRPFGKPSSSRTMLTPQIIELHHPSDSVLRLGPFSGLPIIPSFQPEFTHRPLGNLL